MEKEIERRPHVHLEDLEGPHDELCCLLEEGRRCCRLAGNNSLPDLENEFPYLGDFLETYNLHVYHDLQIPYADLYVCDFHKECIVDDQQPGSFDAQQEHREPTDIKEPRNDLCCLLVDGRECGRLAGSTSM